MSSLCPLLLPIPSVNAPNCSLSSHWRDLRLRMIVVYPFLSLSASLGLGPICRGHFWIMKPGRERGEDDLSLLHQYHPPLPIEFLQWMVDCCLDSWVDGSISIKKRQKIVSLRMAMGDGKVGLTDVPMAPTHPSPASPARIPPADCCVHHFVGCQGS